MIQPFSAGSGDSLQGGKESAGCERNLHAAWHHRGGKTKHDKKGGALEINSCHNSVGAQELRYVESPAAAVKDSQVEGEVKVHCLMRLWRVGGCDDVEG